MPVFAGGGLNNHLALGELSAFFCFSVMLAPRFERSNPAGSSGLRLPSVLGQPRVALQFLVTLFSFDGGNVGLAVVVVNAATKLL